ncbi:MAG TPA: CoA transferase, partial [Alphaproteobacteria bacterium]|nr:CoA transferase [Alphaproteobacteria bacterium]
MSSALEGVVVVDLTREPWAAMASALLGDFGARVVRVEDLGAPRPDAGEGAGAPGLDAMSELVHRNKQSLGLLLGDAQGRALLHELVAGADVLVTDWSRADLAAIGLDHAGARVLREDVVYVRGSGFGPRGPDCDEPAIDELAAARTGVMPT